MGLEDIKRVTLIPLIVFALSVFGLSLTNRNASRESATGDFVLRKGTGASPTARYRPAGRHANDSQPLLSPVWQPLIPESLPDVVSAEPQRLPTLPVETGSRVPETAIPLAAEVTGAPLATAADDSLEQGNNDEPQAPPRESVSELAANDEPAAPSAGSVEALELSPPALTRQPPHLELPETRDTSGLKPMVPVFNAADVKPLENESFPLNMPSWIQKSMSEASTARESQADAAEPAEPPIFAKLDQIKRAAGEQPVQLPPEYQQRWLAQLADAKALVRKGAMFSAEQKVEEVLLDLAHTLDAMDQVGGHHQVLSAGLRALHESGEFFSDESTNHDVDWVRLIANRHETNLPQVRQSTGMSRVEALQHYYDFALEMFLWGSGHQPLAAEAFYTLGRLHQLATQAGVSRLGHFNPQVAVPVEVLYHQTALLLDPTHYRAANELGVLLGRLGDWPAARDVLRQSVQIQPTPAAWRNLAEAHQRMGEWQLAELARQEAIHWQGQSTTGMLAGGQAAAAEANRPYVATENGNSSGTAEMTGRGEERRQGQRRTFVGIR